MFWHKPAGSRAIKRSVESSSQDKNIFKVARYGISPQSQAPSTAANFGIEQFQNPSTTVSRLLDTQPSGSSGASNPKAAPFTLVASSSSKQKSPNEQTNDGLQRPVSELPPRFRSIFPYVSFNRVQSMVFETIMETNKPIVVSAPTGSGKTGVFELAIAKVIMDCERRTLDLGAAKIIYLAPTKALCSERCQDWLKKFSPFNLQVFELTSDMFVESDFKNCMRSSILVATPEKWDSITRSWSGHKAFVQSIRLLLVDEIHLVNDGSRGATLEAVISRMKTIQSIIWPTDLDNLRFIAASATVSNVEDIAQWFSSAQTRAEVFQVDPRERPVKLKTIVLGYTANKDVNEFSFDNLLNHKLPDVIRDFSNDKPTLIFCATRKSASNAATTLVKEGKLDLCYSSEKRKHYIQVSASVKDKTLQETTRYGIAFHHAGLSLSDRKIIEEAFLQSHLFILCCTSTLAMGVNLPAHLVIIKNTSFYDEGKFKPYSESSLVQMMGRAGRPQFDVEATAVIMTKSFCRDDIEKMLTGKLVVDSQLHKHLTEHLNSEIVLGTITNDSIARKWIDATFLHVRLNKNPENYGLRANCSKTLKESTVIGWCSESINKLVSNDIAKRTNSGQLGPTEVGRAMARHYICLDTMVKLIRLTGSESLFDLIMLVSSTYEVASDVQIRNEDKHTLFILNNPKEARNALRFSLGDKIDSREKKAAALIQATFGNISIGDISIYQESLRVVRNASRVVNCLRDIALMNREVSFKLLHNVLILAQCCVAKLWENSIYVSRQLERIGTILSYNLASNNLTTFESLRNANPRNIELFCNRLPPFGSNVQQTCCGLPIYDIAIYFRSVPNLDEKIQMLVEVRMLNGQDIRHKQSLPRYHQNVLIVGNVKDNKLLLRQQVSDAALLARPDLALCFGAELDRTDLPAPNDDIEGHLLSDSFVGLNVSRIVKFAEPINDEL